MSLFDLWNDTPPTTEDGPLNGPASVRSSDPDSSHAAAAAATERLSNQRHRVLVTIADIDRISHRGATAYELMCRLAFDGHAPQQNVVVRRLKDLEEVEPSLVERTDERRLGSGTTGLIVWRPTQAGLDYLAANKQGSEAA